MEPAPDNVPSIENPAADTLFEGQTWGWDGIDHRSMVAQNHNEPSFKNDWIPPSLSFINIFLNCFPLKWLRIVFLSSTSRAMKEADISTFALEYLLRYLVLWILMSTCYVWKRGFFWSVTPSFIKRQIHAPIASGNSCLNNALTPSLVNLGSLTLTPHPMLISFGKFSRWKRHGMTT